MSDPQRVSGHSKERFQAGVMLTPSNTVTVGDLTDAAGTSLGKIRVPSYWGRVQIKAFGFHYDAAGGAQTTAGTMKIKVGATTLQDAAGADFVVTSTASHTANANEETSLNATTSSTNLTQAPSFPTAGPGDVIELVVGTQGAGAGDQTVWPYVIVSQAAGQT